MGVLLNISTSQGTCQFGPNSLEGYQTLSVYYNTVPIMSISGSLILFGRPKIFSIFPKQWREQGDNQQLISVNGSNFIPTGILTCLFKDYENITVRAASYVSFYEVTCPIPPYLHSPILYNVTVELFISNGDSYYSNNSTDFIYFPWCYGFPACGGDDRGICIHNNTGERPYCHCRTTGFDNLTYCFTCLPLHYGPNCLPCPDCHNGTCNDGYLGTGTCTCTFFYTGENCLDFWVNYAAPILGGIILIIIVVVLVLCCRKSTSQKKAP